MPISSIAVILIRLYALNLAIVGFFQSLGIALQVGSHGVALLSSMVPSLGSLITGVILWMIAPRFATLLASRRDENVTLEGVNELTLYTAVFIGVGLWFALSSFAGVFNWLHYFAVSRSSLSAWDDAEQNNFYALASEFLTFIAGLFLVVTGRTWAGKLMASKTRKVDARME